MKYTLISILLTLTVFHLSAEKWEMVRGNSAYLWGEGWGITVADADKQALSDLISKISVNVSSNVSVVDQENITNNNTESSTEFKSVVSTYSQATLSNTEKYIISNEPNAHVVRWILRSEIAKIFESRKNKIKEYVSTAIKAEQSGKIDVALKDYYWALSLVRSLRAPNDMFHTTDDGETVMLMAWLPKRLNDIFSNIKTNVVRRTGDDVEILFTYKGKKISSLDYSYFDGRDWSNIYSAKDGIGLLELAPGNISTSYQVKLEFEYKNESHIDEEVHSVLEAMTGIPMSKAYINIKADVSRDAVKIADDKIKTASFSQISKNLFTKPETIDANKSIVNATNKMIVAINSKNYSGLSDILTPEAANIFERLMKYGNAKIVGTPNCQYYKSGDAIYSRGLQMSFSFKQGMRKSFVEDIVFTYNSDSKICNIAFGLDKTAEDDILGKSVWNEDVRFAIMNFLENYQTAYALKRSDYIETIFDDDAVIIVGNVAKRNASKNLDNNGGQFNNSIITYNRYTKDAYLKKLKESFNSKEYINLRFASNDVRKLGKGGEIYAIQIEQEYYSSNYGDKGYLFLMVDLNDKNNPTIKVRTWQPEKDPNFGIYGPEDFK
jgi:hypothetical protein